MAKIDTILKGVGLAVIVGLGIPVGLSVKFSDGKLSADEIRKEFGIATWTFKVRSPKEFSRLKVELLADVEGNDAAVTQGIFESTFPDGVKSCDLRIYGQEKTIRILCNREKEEVSLPVDISEATIHHLGGKGSEIETGTFLLLDSSELWLKAHVSVE